LRLAGLFSRLFSSLRPGHPLQYLGIGLIPGWLLLIHWYQLEPYFIFFLHNSCTCPFPFFSLPLTTMPLRSLSVTTSQSVDCIVSASVAVLCEIDCRSSACVVQSDRFKKKRVSVIAGKNLILSLSNLQDHQSPSDDYNHQLPLPSMPSNDILPPLPPPSNDPCLPPPSNYQFTSPSNDQFPLLPPPSSYHLRLLPTQE
jgi:hypothetical protein